MAGRGMRQCLRDITVYLVLVLAIATLGSLQYGFHLAELNAPQDVITCRKKSISTVDRITKWVTSSRPQPAAGFLPDCIPMNEAAFATVSSIFTLGGLAGALCAGPFSSRRGRLPAMRATALFYVVGAAVETIAGSVWLMALGRLVSGFGAGASTVIVPLYISEISPPNERGLFGAMTQVSINVGILGTQTLGYFLSYGNAWRWILGVGVCAAALQAVGLLAVPESPAWLAAHADATKAQRTLQRIRGKGFDIQDEVAAWNRDPSASSSAEEEGLLAQPDGVAPPSPTSPGFKKPVHLGFVQVVKDPLCRPAIVAVVGIMFAQQLCGINSIIMYSVSLLADLLPTSSALLTILISVVNLVMTIACAPLPDRLGRKACLLLSIVGQGTSSLALALSIVFGVKILSAISVLFFVAFFAVGLGPVPFILASELVGQEAVGATQSWCLGANYVATFLVAQFFPIINTALNKALGGQGWVYFVFAVLAAGSAVFVSSKVPETLGKKDVDDVWGRTRRLD
ncbi:metabolite transport protein [Tolypocladium capitatum]|uniref:Metabolite transport protein n=1 Tax=Tolypocladium capitatum TaxID=45235 RepID=A0A2K3QKZ0_9HYPO|nr:metabolite transport protein [Tolypocladium capitatum]